MRAMWKWAAAVCGVLGLVRARQLRRLRRPLPDHSLRAGRPFMGPRI